MAWNEKSYPGYQRKVYEYLGASTFVEYVAIVGTGDEVPPNDHQDHAFSGIRGATWFSAVIQILAMIGFSRS